ncbi:hypothetical protein IT407_01210 [Candidatus Uhrbacteria bacterium]|nr:hypothetical protein [Candidatus Uhrbacteria bacterium]
MLLNFVTFVVFVVTPILGFMVDRKAGHQTKLSREEYRHQCRAHFHRRFYWVLGYMSVSLIPLIILGATEQIPAEWSTLCSFSGLIVVWLWYRFFRFEHWYYGY